MPFNNTHIFTINYKKYLTRGYKNDIIYIVIGVWRRLVARFLGVEEVVGSNPVTPTCEKSLFAIISQIKAFLLCFLTDVSASMIILNEN